MKKKRHVQRTLPLTAALLGTMATFLPFTGCLQTAQAGSLSVMQQHIVSGTVTDSKGEPVIGASVRATGSKTGTITDLNGNFKLNVPAGTKITISFVGYEAQTVIAGDKPLNVTLTENQNILKDVQVVAYGVQKKVTVTGAISSVNAKELTRTPVSSVSQVLAGVMTGVSSIQSSGEPGADGASLYIRGQSTFNDASPLIQLDGVVMEPGTMTINDIDPDEIESITVLKDASATAVFGVRGANGVILITTKRGSEGNLKITANVAQSILMPNRPVEMASSYEYATFHNMMQRNDGNQELFSPALVEAFRTHSQPLLFPDTDWPTYIMKSSTFQTKANVNISGGNKRIRYFFSGGAFKQGGLFKDFGMPYNYNYTYRRFNYRSNLDINVTSTTLVSMNVAGSIDTSTKPNVGGSSGDVFKGLYASTPFVSPGIVDGKYIVSRTSYDYTDAEGNEITLPFTGSNGFGNYYGNGYQNNTANMMNLQMSIQQDLKMITKGLSFTLKGAYNSNFSIAKSGEQAVPIYYARYLKAGYQLANGTVLDEPMVVLQKNGQLGEPTHATKSGKARNWYMDARLNYTRSFGRHNVTGLLLYNQTKRYYPSTYSDIPTGYVGLVGRITYDYANRYMLDFNMGYNGSENFAPERRFGFFPAGSVGWAVSEEKFFEPLKKVIDFFKLRASWGLVGNDAGLGKRFYYTPDVYSYNSGLLGNGGGYGYNFGIENGTTFLGAYEALKHNKDVGWEKSFKQNYGFDMNLLNSRLRTSFDYYKEHRTNILLSDATAPGIIGFTVPMANLGVVDSWGWEVSAKWMDKIGRNFSYWAGVNVSYNQNKVIERKEAPKNNAYQMSKGHRLGSISLYKFFEFYNEGTAERYQQTFGEPMPQQLVKDLQYGDCVYVDLDHNGIIDTNDMSRELSHTQDPEYTIGLNLGFRWKSLEVNTQWTGALNVVRVLDGTFRMPFYSPSSKTQGGLLKYHIDHTWTAENPSQDAKYPRVSQNSYVNNYEASTLYAADAKYLRLKTLSVTYDFKFPFMKKLGMDNLQLGLSGYNLLTFTPFIWGDPETNVTISPSYPLQRTFTLTLKVGF